jgi:hypothetical protein
LGVLGVLGIGGFLFIKDIANIILISITAIFQKKNHNYYCGLVDFYL